MSDKKQLCKKTNSKVFFKKAPVLFQALPAFSSARIALLPCFAA